MAKKKRKSVPELEKELASAKRSARAARRENKLFQEGAKWAQEHMKESNR